MQSWPKDSYIEGAKSEIKGPGWSHTIEANVMATGTAAKTTAGLVTEYPPAR
jgi:hypothetical protein